LTLVKQTIKWLAEEKYLPAACVFPMRLKKPEGTDTYCWRPEEAAAIISHCRENAELDWIGDVFTALIATGLWISELAPLRWSDLDFGANVVRLRDESSRKRGGTEVRQTKSGHSRALPIHEMLKEVLGRTTRSQDGVVFHGPWGGRIKADTVRNVLVRDVLTPLAPRFPTPHGEVAFLNGRLHSCRHYFCSVCANSGYPEQALMSWLGHRDSKMVRHYYHVHDGTAQRQMGRLRLLGEAGAADTAGEGSDVEPKPVGKKTRKKK
jgi:integrase